MKRCDQSHRKNRPLLPKGGNDRVYTPDALARDIVLHFSPSGRILEPCCGGGAFLRAMPGCDWCEIDKGMDFFACTGRYDWIVTNPPYSLFRKVRPSPLKPLTISFSSVPQTRGFKSLVSAY